MWLLLRIWVYVLAVALPGVALAQCDFTYEVQPGDTLFSIAETHYDDREKWTLVYYANQGVLNGVEQIAPGLKIHVPCPSGDDQPGVIPRKQTSAALTMLTGGDYAPFVDKEWPAEGMATELINAALAAGPSPVSFEVVWEDDWGQHLFPLLDQKTYDMGFPWVKPDCTSERSDKLCQSFHYSEPLIDLPIMLFKREDSDFTYETDADIAGKTLCRPAGYSTHDLDRADRQWLTSGAITLMQPDSPEACFEALMAGDVDAVTLNVFLGASKIVSMGLRGQAVPIDLPLSHEKLHVVISKLHWRGTTHLYRLNAGLAALRDSGQYDEIVSRHLEIFWDQLK